MATLDTKLEHWATNNLPLDKFSKLLTNKGMKSAKRDSLGSSSNGSSSSSSNGPPSQQPQQQPQQLQIQHKTVEQLAANLNLSDTSENSDGSVTCSYCAISFADKNELRQHCQTETHQNLIMSDEGRDWKWRPPPRGYTVDSYSQCESYSESQLCHYGNQCVEAHGIAELHEWKERFEYRKMRLQRACEKELYGKSFTEELLEKWVQATSPDKIMREKIDGIEEQCSNELVTTISSKVSKREWAFVLKTRRHLRAVALLQDSHRHHFSIKSILPGDAKTAAAAAAAVALSNAATATTTTLAATNTSSKKAAATAPSNSTTSGAVQSTKQQLSDIELSGDQQEWVAPIFDRSFQPTSESPLLEHRIKIAFTTDIYGTFRQSVCFDFGNEPVLVKHICVDVVPVGDAEKIQEIKKDIISSASQRWDDSNTTLVKFETTIGSHLKTEAYLSDVKHEKDLLERYPCPRAATFTLTLSTIVDKRLTRNNYRSRIHELLYVEEIARYEQIARYNLSTKLRIASNYMLTPSGMATSTAKYSHSGELFGLMSLGKDVSEDTSAGRLILSNCTSVYLSDSSLAGTESEKSKREVYEAMIEDKGKNMIYLKLSAKCVQGLNLKADSDFQSDVQFQLNRLSYCEWHNAVDKIADFRIIFPDTYIEPNIPWTPKKQWSDASDPKLNTKQKEAINAITTPINCHLPPILLIGPFGTGKTYTLAQAIKNLLTQPDAKILICTHSNSAADLYIKEYLHPWVEKGMKEATPLRVYYHKRWVATVNSVVQKYCIIDGNGNFRRPSVEDILKHRIVVVTLNISMELASLGLPKGYFTHIFLDEAAQAMECEAIMPLALASENTRIVLAGDHMQMSPELFSNFAKERKLHISLLERLYDHYPSNFPCKILLCENYRAHEAIIKFTSELFYEQKLIASGKQPKHEKFYPLTFFTTRGEDVQDKNSTAFYNNSEVYEVVERVCELKKKWPSSWGKLSDQSIGIMTPYADQVFRIRSELRKRRMGGISVERVLNVQGKQFRAIFLSTVRTRRTCTPNNNSGMGVTSDDSDYGFLSNSKLLNTAITRAQSLVAVVGDPVALCSIGRCRKVWERFIEICNQNKSLFGITWSYLRSQLDGVELKRSYVLNPLAPEFVPRSLQPESYLRQQQSAATTVVGQPTAMPTAPLNQIPQTYANHPFGGMMNPTTVGSQALQKAVQVAAAHASPMQMRPIGHPAQGYNMAVPPQGAAGQQPYSPYLMWPQQQQQQPQSSPLIRPNYTLQPQPNMPPPHQQLTQNPNVSLWGPPPQNNPWGVVPKSVGNQSVRPSAQQPQIPTPQSLNMAINNLNMRPPTVPAPPQLQQQTVQTMRSPQDLAHLSKFVYQNASTNFNNPNPVMLNQMNIRNQLHNGPASPADVSRGGGGGIGGGPHAGNLAAHSYLNQTGNPFNKDKEIQFLNNVHNIPLNMNASPLQLSTGQPYPDYSVLLPPNMNFYDMALEPKEFQYKWYLQVLEQHGQEAANKFTEVLRQVVATANSMSKSQQLGHQQQQQQQQLSHGGLSRPGIQQIGSAGAPGMASSSLGPPSGTNNSSSGNQDNNNINFNQQIDLVFHSLMNGNEMSQPILRDLLGMVSSNTNISNNGSLLSKEAQQQQQQQQQHHQSLIQQQQQQQQQQIPPQHQSHPQSQQIVHGSQIITASATGGPDLTITSRIESVPLYRRQVMGNGSSTSGYNSAPSSHPASIGSPDHLHEALQNSSMMESLFTANEMNPYANVNSIQKLFHSYQMKQQQQQNDCSDLMMQPIRAQSGQSQLQQHYGQQQSQSGSSGGSTTYASVLSQGQNQAGGGSVGGGGGNGGGGVVGISHPNQQQQTLNPLMHMGGGPPHPHHQHHHNLHDDRDPFASIRELGQRSNGFYNYFQ